MKKIPVNIISGFLGAGKTTAILQVISQKTTDDLWAVVINEYGKTSIDSQTLKSNSLTGKVFDISGGCICCTAKGYLNESLEEIIESGLYSRIIIEPSGLGGIDMVSEIVEAKPALELKPVICLVDITALNIPRLQMNPVYQRQIAKSDRIVFTKTDLVDTESSLNEHIHRFKTNFPETIIHSQFRITPSLLELDYPEKQVKKAANAFTLFDPTLSATNYLQKNCIFEADTIFDTEKLSHFLLEHTSIIRAKGYVKTMTSWKLMNYTLSRCSFDDCNVCSQNEIVIICDKSEEAVFENLDSEIRKSIL